MTVDGIKIYDNGGATFDRYTVIIGESFYSMSHNPLSPQGVNQYCGETWELNCGSLHTQTEVWIGDLPPDVQDAIKNRINGM